MLAAKNEITSEYKLEMDQSSVKRMKKGRLAEIISEVKRKNNLDKDVVILESTIRKRLTRGTTFSNGVGGHTSPLSALEPTFVATIVQMARIRQSLTPAQALELINGMITGAAAQLKLMAFKKKYSTFNSDVDARRVGPGYWRGFRKRNDHLLVSKKGCKFELDRSQWSTYSNFGQMYDQIGEELVDAGLATEREVAAWMDIHGKVVHETDAFGCKVTHDIEEPDWVLLMDEVGGNTNQKGDGQVGGELQMCERGTVP